MWHAELWCCLLLSRQSIFSLFHLFTTSELSRERKKKKHLQWKIPSFSKKKNWELKKTKNATHAGANICVVMCYFGEILCFDELQRDEHFRAEFQWENWKIVSWRHKYVVHRRIDWMNIMNWVLSTWELEWYIWANVTLIFFMSYSKV